MPKPSPRRSPDGEFNYLMLIRPGQTIDTWIPVHEFFAPRITLAKVRERFTGVKAEVPQFPSVFMLEMRARLNNMDILHVRFKEEQDPDQFEAFLQEMTPNDYREFAEKHRCDLGSANPP